MNIWIYEYVYYIYNIYIYIMILCGFLRFSICLFEGTTAGCTFRWGRQASHCATPERSLSDVDGPTLCRYGKCECRGLIWTLKMRCPQIIKLWWLIIMFRSSMLLGKSVGWWKTIIICQCSSKSVAPPSRHSQNGGDSQIVGEHSNTSECHELNISKRHSKHWMHIYIYI